MRALKIYKGVGLGDIIKVSPKIHPRKKLAKVLKIYKQKEQVRFLIQMAGNTRIDIHESEIIYSQKETLLCECKMLTLMREGCICGGD